MVPVLYVPGMYYVLLSVVSIPPDPRLLPVSSFIFKKENTTAVDVKSTNQLKVYSADRPQQKAQHRISGGDTKPKPKKSKPVYLVLPFPFLHDDDFFSLAPLFFFVGSIY
ncbi:unnamed protein product [Laminaria digitata]